MDWCLKICNNRLFITLVIVGIYLLHSTVQGLMCVKCSTIVQRGRQDCLTGNILPINCTDANQTSCIKYEGILDGLKFVFRDCDGGRSQDLCEERSIADENVRTCSYRCFADGCNGGSISIHDTSVSTPYVTFLFLWTLSSAC